MISLGINLFRFVEYQSGYSPYPNLRFSCICRYACFEKLQNSSISFTKKFEKNDLVQALSSIARLMKAFFQATTTRTTSNAVVCWWRARALQGPTIYITRHIFRNHFTVFWPYLLRKAVNLLVDSENVNSKINQYLLSALLRKCQHCNCW